MQYYYEVKEMEINQRKNLDFPAHLQDKLEMGYIEAGSVTLTVDGSVYALQAGDFFLVFPNQIHSYERSRGIRARMMIFDPKLISEFESVLSSKIPVSPIVSQEEDAKKVVELLFQVKSDNIHVLRGFLLVLVGMLLDKLELKDVDTYNISTLKNLLIYCSQHFRDGITVSDVSNELHLSRYYIAHIFREKLHTTFSEYITGKRVEYACTLLADRNLSIAEIAHQSGFNSLRSFNRNFLQCRGISPKEYRKNLQ